MASDQQEAQPADEPLSDYCRLMDQFIEDHWLLAARYRQLARKGVFERFILAVLSEVPLSTTKVTIGRDASITYDCPDCAYDQLSPPPPSFIDELFEWTRRRGARRRISAAARRHPDSADAHFDDDRIVLTRR